MHDSYFFRWCVGYLVNQLVNRLGGAFLLYLPCPQGIERIDNDIFIVPVKCDMVSFFFHNLHLRLPFLLFIPCRLVFLHTLIHIALDFAQNITHRTKLSLEHLRIHSVILSGKSGKIKAFGIYAVTGAYHIGNAKGFEIGSVTALIVLEVIDRRRYFLCHTDKQRFFGQSLLTKMVC